MLVEEFCLCILSLNFVFVFCLCILSLYFVVVFVCSLCISSFVLVPHQVHLSIVVKMLHSN